jgi:folate-dependent phosphoribosylglycinamide formyltransferase PurN
MLKIGILTGTSINSFGQKILEPVLNDRSMSVVVALSDCRPKKTLRQKIRKNFRRRRGGYMLVMALNRLFEQDDATLSAGLFCKQHAIQCIETDQPYDLKTIGLLKQFNPDILILIGGFGIVKEPLLSLAPLGILSYHHGNMRKYRGMPPAFWELYNNEKEMGVTVQILQAGLDCGIPVVEKTIEIHRSDNQTSLTGRAMKESEEMLYLSIKKLQDEHVLPAPVEQPGKIYTLPNLRQWVMLQMKLLARKILRR